MVTYQMARGCLGQWVRCHSIYGWHRGIVSNVVPSGIVLSNAGRLASFTAEKNIDLEHGIYNLDNMKEDISQVQFFGGFFLPFGGLYGLYPFGFGGFLW